MIQVIGKFKIDFLKLIAEAIGSLSGRDIADLRIPEYRAGEVLCAGNGKTCIILEVHPKAPPGVEYTILWDGEIHEHVLEASLDEWSLISEVDQDPFMLSI